MQEIQRWLADVGLGESAVKWIAISSGAFLVITLLALPVVFVLLPPDAFRRATNEHRWADRDAASKALVVVRNVVGVVLLLLGVALLLLPGQGLLTIALALALMDFPGKRSLLLRLLRRPRIEGGINKLRARFRRPELEIPQESAA